MKRRLIVALTGSALLAFGPQAAHAEESGGTVATVDVAVRSITVTPDTVQFGDCLQTSSSTLTFPNDLCAAFVTVTNGTAPSHIYVRATDLQGVDGGTPWDLCDQDTCTGENSLPGVDQARVQTGTPQVLANSDACDAAWSDTGCEASAGPDRGRGPPPHRARVDHQQLGLLLHHDHVDGVAMKRALIATAAIAIVLAAVPPAHADESGSSTGTVSVAVRSVTVTPDTFTFGDCQAGGTVMSFPNDNCSAQVTITNGTAPAHIMIRATDFAGSEGGTPWDLCIVDTPCSGTDGNFPGVDQARIIKGFPSDDLSNDDICDTAWWPEGGDAEGCAAQPNQSVTESLILYGPESTTNGSPLFSTTVVWTALP